MKYIPIAKLLKTKTVKNPIASFKDKNVQVLESQLSKLLNNAKAEQRIADMNVLEVKIEKLARNNATAAQVIDEINFFISERKTIANALKNNLI